MHILKQLIIGLSMINFVAQAQYQTTPNEKGNNYYTNPIFAGDFPDPSLLKDGDTYYMVTSTFEYYPGLSIWESHDLINWSPLANALHQYLGSVWAPDLVKYNNKYYIYFPADGKIYAVWADQMEGPWSDPVDLKINNIDPGHIADDEGKRYLYSANGGYVPLSKDGLSVVGETKHVYDGWTIPQDWSIECFCMEGPKLVKHGKYYYLTVAEGGTAGPATGHMIISARSKTPIGPWENSPYNPIERTENISERWCSKGHGTLFEDSNGEWWMMFHGYEKEYYTMGRQVLLLPVEWTEDEWYKIPNGIDTENPVRKPKTKTTESTFSLCDNFSGETLSPQWKFFEEYNPDRFSINNNSLFIKAKGNSIYNCSPLLCVPSHHSYMAEVEMEIEENSIGGLVLFYNNNFNSGILANGEDILVNLKGWQFATAKGVTGKHVFLRLKNQNHIVDMYYSTNGELWHKIENSFNESGMHHNVLSGFMSLRIGLVSTGMKGVTFKNFKYMPIK